MERKPWEEYPHLWKTESSFWTYVRGSLRRALWDKSPIKLDFKNKAVSPPPKGYSGRAKSGEYCALSGEWEGKSKLEVDHKVGNVSLKGWDDLMDFILHLIPEPDTLQLVKKEAHKIKSYAENQGISYEEAKAIKGAISIEKSLSIFEQKEYIRGKSLNPKPNKSQRRLQLVYLLSGGSFGSK